MISLRMGSWLLVKAEILGEDEVRTGLVFARTRARECCEKGMRGRVNTKLKTTLQESASITVITYRSSMENAQVLS
jgi:hypothetical protein